MARESVDFPFRRGFVHAPNELGHIVLDNIRVFPYAQPQPNFEITKDDQVVGRYTTNGVRLIQDNLGDWTQPILVRAGHGLMASLMISPPGQNLLLSDVRDMRIVHHHTGMLMHLGEARFGLPAGSAIVFAEKYSGQLKFVDIDLLPEDDY